MRQVPEETRREGTGSLDLELQAVRVGAGNSIQVLSKNSICFLISCPSRPN